MNTKPVLYVLATVLGSGLVEFSTLVSTGTTAALPIAAGISGAVGTSLMALFVRMPQKKWSNEERTAKLGVK